MNKDQTLIKIEKWLNIIGDSLDSPIWKDGTFVYEKITVKHVAYLKAVRAVSSLHSLSLLYKKGLAIDGGTILRCLFDCLNEIYFLLENYPDTSVTVDKHVRHFESTSLISKIERTETIISKKIHSAHARVYKEQLNFSDCRNSIRKIFEIFSGYVHSNYPHIMEIYGGDDLTFHIRGVSSPKKITEFTALFEGAIGSTETSLGFMAMKLGLSELFEEIKENLI